jgi:hypothetical protein
MFLTSFFVPAATTCQQSSTAAGIVGVVIFLGLIAGVIVLAILNSDARNRLAVANAELGHLRPENARLHQWIAGLGGAAPASEAVPAAEAPSTARPAAQPAARPAARPATTGGPTAPPQWSPDPSGRHQLRYWDGSAWSHHVADAGLTSTDPAE